MSLQRWARQEGSEVLPPQHQNTSVHCAHCPLALSRLQGFYDPDKPSPELGLETAGEHLAERFGPAFQTVWAVGLLASGQVATISLTYAGQLVMTGLLGFKVRHEAQRVRRSAWLQRTL